MPKRIFDSVATTIVWHRCSVCDTEWPFPFGPTGGKPVDREWLCVTCANARVAKIQREVLPALQKCLGVLSLPALERYTHAEKCVEVDPAGNTYELTPHAWFVQAKEVLERNLV